MFSKTSLTRQLISTLAVSGCLITGFPLVSWAQSNPGLTIFSGVDNREDILDYHLKHGEAGTIQRDRYKLRIPADKMEQGASQFTVSYPDYYNGEFDPDEIEVRVQGESVPLQEVSWNEEEHRVEIIPKQPIEGGENGKEVELVFSNVENPRTGGTYYFNGQIQALQGSSAPRYVGTWILSLN
jgi:hypothetical protein